ARDEIARRVPAGTNSHRLSLSVPRIGGQSTNRERLCHRAAPAAGDQGSGVEKAGTRLRLQAAGHGGPALAQARRRPAPPPGASGGEVQRRHHAGASRSRRAEGGRLITLDPQHLTIAPRRGTGRSGPCCGGRGSGSAETESFASCGRTGSLPRYGASTNAETGRTAVPFAPSALMSSGAPMRRASTRRGRAGAGSLRQLTTARLRSWDTTSPRRETAGQHSSRSARVYVGTLEPFAPR